MAGQQKQICLLRQHNALYIYTFFGGGETDKYFSKRKLVKIAFLNKHIVVYFPTFVFVDL